MYIPFCITSEVLKGKVDNKNNSTHQEKTDCDRALIILPYRTI